MYAIGIDIGGTSAKLAVVDLKGEIHFRREVVWKSIEKIGELFTPLLRGVKLLEKSARQSRKNIAGIGMAAPGYLNKDRSGIIFAANILALNGFPLVSSMERESGKRAILDTDVNAGGIAEALLGAGRKFKKVMYVNLGTGVGASLVDDRTIVRHTRNGVGHLGHITLIPGGEKCGCGNNGCIETVISIRGIQRIAKELLTQFPESILNYSESKNKILTPYLIYKAARENRDRAAMAIFKHVGTWLGHALYNYCVIYVPEAIVIGGGVSEAGDLLIRHAQKTLNQQLNPKLFSKVKIKKSQFGKDAGVIGAALNFLQYHIV